MADINKEASWVTARLMEVSNATQDGTNILITNANIQNFTPTDVVRTSAQTLTDAEQAQVRTNIGAASQSDIAGVQSDIADLSDDKMDKLPEGSVAGNIPLIDNNENIADSGISKDNLLLSPQLNSHIYAEDQTPYLYRQTGGGVEVGTREYDSIVGGSVVWNQKIPNGDFSDLSAWRKSPNLSWSVANNIATVEQSGVGQLLYQTGLATTVGHIYLISLNVKLTTPSNGWSVYGLGRYAENRLLAAQASTNWQHLTTVFSMGTANPNNLYITDTAIAQQSYALKEVYLIDLTEMLGSTVASRILAMEQTSAGSGIAVLNAMGLNQYRPYTAEPTLLSAMPTAHKTVGFNIWDEQWQQAIINAQGNIVATGSNYIASKNFIPVFPNTTYQIKIPRNTMYVFEYAADGTYLRNTGGANGSTFTTSADCHKIRFYLAYGVPYKGNICINISDPLRNGTLEPYEEHTYPLAGIELRGVWVVNSDGSISCDGDTYAPDGTVTRRYAVLTLNGTEALWYKSGTYDGSFYLGMSGRNYNGNGNVICAKLITVHSLSNYAIGCLYPTTTDISFWFAEGVGKTLAQFKEWLSSNPFTIIYEVITPTVETATPYDALQVCDPLGTEEYVDERSVPVPVGHVTKYPVDQVAKLDGLPSDFSTLIAPTEKEFKASATRTTGFKFIYQNQLYKCIANVASGAAYTIGTNVKKTTIAEELDLLA